MAPARLGRLLAVALIVLLLSPLAASQDAIRPSADVPRIAEGETVELDGLLDEALWQRAARIGPLTQTRPVEGIPMSVDTDVLLTYDDEFVYIGIHCHDDPADVRARQMERDAFVRYDDVVELWFDPFGSDRFAYWFQVTPGGSLGDALIADNGASFNKDWDGIWYGKSQVVETGWIAELAIPFKTLSFDPSAPSWGFNVLRKRVANGEEGRWASPYVSFGFFQVSDGGRLTGIGGIDQGVGLDVLPYIKVQGDRGDSRRSFGSEWDTGVDIRWRPTPTATLLVTTNTDFAETEVDARQLNLGRFPLFFPEKRDFFLEDAGAFEFGAPMNRRSLLPFFSRTIGRDDNGAAVPILGGVKLSGRFGPWTVGLLDAYVDGIPGVPATVDDAAVPRIDEQNLGVLRVSRSLGEGRSIGGIVTTGDPNGGSGTTTFGVDGRAGSSEFFGAGHSGFLWGWLLGTRGSDERSALAYGFEARARSSAWETELSAQRTEAGFSPTLGFVRRTAVDRFDLDFDRTWRFADESTWFRTFEMGSGATVERDLDGIEDSWFVPVELFNAQFWSQDSIRARVTRRGETIQDAFGVGGNVTVAPGSYEETRGRLSFETNDRRRVKLEGSFEAGDYYGGDIERLRFEPVLIPNEHLAIGGSFEDISIDLGDGGDLRTQLYSVRFDVLFDPFTSLKSFLQYDTASKNLSAQTRLRWIIQPGQELFLVGLFGFSKAGQRESFASEDQSLALKLALTFRF